MLHIFNVFKFTDLNVPEVH